MVASLFLNLFMSALKGHPEDMSSPGLISFGYVGVSIKIKRFIVILSTIFSFLAFLTERDKVLLQIRVLR